MFGKFLELLVVMIRFVLFVFVFLMFIIVFVYSRYLRNIWLNGECEIWGNLLSFLGLLVFMEGVLLDGFECYL